MRWRVSERARIWLVAGLVGAVAGSVVAMGVVAGTKSETTTEDLIAAYYETETAVRVSPHHIRKAMSKGDKSFVLVDLRSPQEYEAEHIVGAVSIPAYVDPGTSAYEEVERIVGQFRQLPKDKDIIVYCYSIPCMTGRKVGKMLADNGIYVKHLGVGWNEWRYFWNLWNHEHEWEQTQVEDYVVTGGEPGELVTEMEDKTCPIEGGLGC